MRSRSLPRRSTSWSRMTSAIVSSAPQRRATIRIARSEYPDSAACTAGSAYVRGPIFSKDCLLRLHVVAVHRVPVAEIHLAADDDRMGPRGLGAVLRLLESAFFLIAGGGGLDEGNLALTPILAFMTFAAGDDMAVGVGDRSFADALVLPNDVASREFDAAKYLLVIKLVEVIADQDDPAMMVHNLVVGIDLRNLERASLRGHFEKVAAYAVP